jgi:TolB-like protein/Tfp pilus assembly protein PilF
LIEVAGTVFPGFGIPDWAFRFVVIVLALGFVPVMIFTWAYEVTPEGLKREKDVVRDAATEQRTARRLDGLTIGLIVVALVFIAVDRLWLGSLTGEPPAPAVGQATEAASANASGTELPRNSVAVLPFANRSDNPKDVFFVDGIHDDLLTYISQIGSLKVISRTSVMEYRDTLKKIPQIARELGVAHVLEGGVQRAVDQVRINVQLIEARTDDHLWSQIYDRELTATNIFAIQSEIAGAIAEALRAELTPQTRERIERVPTENLAALEEYFLGRQSMGTRTVVDLARAVEHLEQAVALDPEFALAHASLALAYALYRNYAGLPLDDWYDKGEAAAERALSLDPGLAEAYTSVATIKWYRQDYEGAERAFKRAIQFNPNEAQAFQWLGVMLGMSMGRLEEGLGYSRKAVTLNPKSAIMLADYGEVLNRAGRPDEARAQYRQAVAIEPRFSKGHRLLGDLAIDSGELDQAISAYHKALDIEPGNWRLFSRMGSIYLFLGDDQRAEYWFRLALEQAPRGVEQIGADLGSLYMFRGDKERAREQFDSALATDPNDQRSLYHLANLDLSAGDVAVALARYQQAFPDMLDDAPVVDERIHVAAIHLAALLARAGEAERTKRLLDLAWQDAQSYKPRHFGDEAAIHALLGNDEAALDALGSMDPSEKIQTWREFVVGHPAFAVLLDDPGFRALDEEFEAEMARQLARVREWEASGELAPVPNK